MKRAIAIVAAVLAAVLFTASGAFAQQYPPTSTTTTTEAPDDTTPTDDDTTPVSTPIPDEPDDCRPPQVATDTGCADPPAVDNRNQPPAKAVTNADELTQGKPGTQFGPPAKIENNARVPTVETPEELISNTNRLANLIEQNEEVIDKEEEAYVERGARMELSSCCFRPGSTVTVYINSTPRRLGTALVGANGRYSVLVSVPPDMPAGDHTVVAVAKGTDGKAVLIAAPVKVVAKAKAAARYKCPAPKPQKKTAKAKKTYADHVARCNRQAATARKLNAGRKFPGLLKIKSKGPNVLLVQQALGQKETGKYSNQLFAAVRAFQRANNIKVKRYDVGAVNKKTWDILFYNTKPKKK